MMIANRKIDSHQSAHGFRTHEGYSAPDLMRGCSEFDRTSMSHVSIRRAERAEKCTRASQYHPDSQCAFCITCTCCRDGKAVQHDT